MGRKLYEESNISAIANAIRNKNGTNNTYKTSEMAGAILDLSAEGGGITPSGTLPITSNGNYNVINYANVEVSVPTEGEGVTPSGTIEIKTNGEHDVANYAKALVSVPTSGNGSNLDLNVEENNQLVSQMLQAIVNGTVWTGTFTHEGADGKGISGKTAIIDTGLAKINGLMCYAEITEDDYSVSTVGTTEMAIMGFDENGSLITSGSRIGVIETYTLDSNGLRRQVAMVGSSNNIGFTYAKDTVVENGVLYVTPSFDANVGYTPFWMGKTYSFIVW